MNYIACLIGIFFIYKLFLLLNLLMSSTCYRLCDLIDIVEELLAVVKALPDGTTLEDPLERGVYGVPVESVRPRLEAILHQLFFYQKSLD